MLESNSPLNQLIKLAGVVIATIVFIMGSFFCVFLTFLIYLDWNDTSVKAPGDDSSHFDPIASVQEVQAYAGDDMQLVSIHASYVHEDGTLNLIAQGVYATTRYIFIPKSSVPTHESSTNTNRAIDKHYFQGIEVTVGRSRRGMTKNAYILRTPPPAAVPLPTCSLAALYDQIIIDGQPWTGSAGVKYDEDGYLFELYDYGVITHVRFDNDCNKIEE